MGLITILSIDNMYEDDGIANLSGAIRSAQRNGGATDGFRILGMFPEYKDNVGRLDKVHVVMQQIPTSSAYADAAETAMVEAPTADDVFGMLAGSMSQILALVSDARQAAEYRKLDAAPPIQVKPSDGKP
jgi:hypothetical protein